MTWKTAETSAGIPQPGAAPACNGIGARLCAHLSAMLTVLLAGTLFIWTASAQPATTTNRAIATILVVRGADGEAEYAMRFDQQIEQWQAMANQAGVPVTVIGAGSTAKKPPAQDEDSSDQPTANTPGDLKLLEEAIAQEAHPSPLPLWLVFIGHGTFDGHRARFNLRGPDVSAEQLADRLKPIQRPLVIINSSAASAPFMAALAGPDRIVITATRSGNEQNYAHFGEFLAGTISAPAADLDQDGQTSLLESFLSASSKVTEFYQTEGRLATEHALIDDNGDGLGTPAEWFRGIRAVRKAQENRPLDGQRAHQIHLILSPQEQLLSAEVRDRRDDLERRLFALREEKEKLPEAGYYARLEKLLLEIAALYVEGTTNAAPPAAP